MIKTFCDGCGVEFSVRAGRTAALHGERNSHTGDRGMPSGRFHLCDACGAYAFAALRERREALNAKTSGGTT